jgi:hypothetical protein
MFACLDHEPAIPPILHNFRPSVGRPKFIHGAKVNPAKFSTKIFPQTKRFHKQEFEKRAGVNHMVCGQMSF